MFKMVTGGNGRSIYAGKVTQVNEKAFEIAGTEWDANAKKFQEVKLQLLYDSEISEETRKKVTPGLTLCVMVMPHRKIPNLGHAEEIAFPGEALSIISDRGKERLVLNGIVLGKKWNDKKNRISVSFINIHDTEGHVLGFQKTKNYSNGQTATSAFLNVNYFVPSNNSQENNYNAERIDKSLQKGDSVVMVIAKSVKEYNGRQIVNYNGQKFMVTEKYTVQNAQDTSATTTPEPPKTQDVSSNSKNTPVPNHAPVNMNHNHPSAHTSTNSTENDSFMNISTDGLVDFC